MFISNYTGSDIDTAVGKVLDGKVGGMTQITYTKLKQLRDNSQLIPGMQYRITDYETMTSQINTKSAGHQFDIIVTADSESVLNEKARAIQHEGDTYFANSNLAAWEIWYCLDNDTDRFAWAKKPLYYDGDRDMINVLITSSNDYFIYIRYPEKNKDGKYAWTTDVQLLQDETFKNVVDNVSVNLSEINIISTDEEKPGVGTAVIAFGNSDCKIVDVSWTEGKGVIYRMIDEFGNDCPYDFKNIMFLRNYDDGDFVWYYTFTNFDQDLQEGVYSISDCSVYPIRGYEGTSYCYNNIIKCCAQTDYNIVEGSRYDKIYYYYSRYLNDIVMICESDHIANYSNTFDFNCHNITLNSNCYLNTFDFNCHNITLNNSCYLNTFGNDCGSIVIYGGGSNNTFLHSSELTLNTTYSKFYFNSVSRF